jgi:PAS domain S-box-containing protein
LSEPPLRILMLEDLAVDAELIADELQRAGFKLDLQRVEDEAHFCTALDTGLPDVILADWTLPRFSGRAALTIARRRCPEVPFIFVSGKIGEAAALEALRHGATDYVYKHQLDLLATTLARALDETRERRQRHAAEQETLRANARFAALLGAMVEAVMETDAEGAVVWGNARWIEYIGMPVEQCLGFGWLNAVHPEDRKPLEATIRASMESGESRLCEFRVVRGGAGVRWLYGHCAPLHGLAGERTGWVVTMADISDRKAAEEGLRDSTERLTLALDAAGEAIFDLRLDTGVLVLSPECYTMLGYECDEFPATVPAWAERVHPDERDGYLAGLQAFLDDPAPLTCSAEFRARSKDGGWLWLLGRRKKVAFDAAGRVTRIVSTVLNISERKRTEHQIARLNAAYKAMSEINKAIVHLDNEQSLFHAACRIVVECGEFGLAWIGRIDEAGCLREIAHHGPAADFLLDPRVVASNTDPHSTGTFMRAARNGLPSVVQDCEIDCGCAPMVGEVCVHAGLYSCMAVPLRGGGLRGVLVVHARDKGYFDDSLAELLTEIGADVSFALDNFERERQRGEGNHRFTRMLEDTLEVVAGTLEARDPYTAGHQRRVAKLAVAIGRELGLDNDRLHGLYLGGIVHDIGKITVPGDLLTKPARLNKLEYGLIQMHPQAGFDLLKRIEFPWPIARIVLEHHERLDGSGYPQGLKGAEILLEAQIIAVADIVEAMASHRPYRPALGVDAALAEIVRLRGSALAPSTVDACVRVFRERGYRFDDWVGGPG